MPTHRPLALIVRIAALALLAAGHGSQMTSGGSHAISGSQAAGRAQRPAHLIVVMEENHSFEQIIGSRSAPFLNRLAGHGTLLTRYYAVTHPSLPNYVALLSGRTPIESDCHGCTFTGPTLIDQLEAGRISWAAYSRGLPGPAPRCRTPVRTPRRSTRSCTPSTSATTPPAATGSSRSTASPRTWPPACCPPSCSSCRISTTRCTPGRSGSPTAGCSAWL